MPQPAGLAHEIYRSAGRGPDMENGSPPSPRKAAKK